MFNNPFLKNDSLFEAVRKAQAEGADRRQAEAQVNEEFGVYSRKAVIREQLAAYDARLAELVEAKKADKDYDRDGKIESPKAEVLGSRIRAAKAAGKLEEGNRENKEKKKEHEEKTGMEHIKKMGGFPGQSPKRTARELTKEEEQIDELSKNTLGSYVGKAAAANYGKEKLEREKGVKLAMDKITGRYGVVKGTTKGKGTNEETDYSAQDRAPVTKSAPKEDPSTPKSYPGAASSLTAGNPTSQRMSNAKTAVSPIKEAQIDELYGKGSLGKIKGHHEKEARKAYKKMDKVHGLSKVDSLEKKGDYHSAQGERASDLLSKTSPKPSRSGDRLASRYPSKGAVTRGARAGKMYASDKDEMKANIKWSLGKHKKPNLPEEAMNEAAYSAKAARAGKDIGKPGKMFSKIAAKAGEKYGSKERGEKVAGAILKNIRAKHVKEENLQELSAFGKAFAAAGGKNFTFGGKEYSGARADQKTSSVPTPPTKPAELKTSTTWKDPVSAGYDKPAVSSAPAPKAAPAPTMTTASPSTGAGAGVDTSVKSPTSGEKVNYAAPDVKAGQDKMKAMASLKESVQVGTSKYRIV